MNIELPIFSLAAPEITVLCMTSFILLLDVFLAKRFPELTYVLAQVTLIIGFLLTVKQYQAYPHPVITFSGSYMLDKLALLTKLFVLLTTVFAFIYARQYIRNRHIPKGEYYVLGLFSVVGMLAMASAYSLLTMYLGLELLSLSLYAMVALQKDSRVAVEAAMKYFVMGAMASGLLLYGMSMIYGMTGKIDIFSIAQLLQKVDHNQEIVIILGLVFILAGLIGLSVTLVARKSNSYKLLAKRYSSA